MNSIIDRLLKTAKKDKDLKMIESIYNGYSQDPIIKFEYAKILLYYGHFEKANKLFLELLDSRNADYAILELGRLQKVLGNIKKAREYFEYLVSKEDPAAIYELGKLELQYGKLDNAKELFLSLKNDKLWNYARIELGNIEAQRGNVEEAKKYYLSAKKLTKAKIALGRLEKDFGDVEKARKTFDNLRNSNDLSGTFELGNLELSLKNYDKARAIFSRLYNNYGVYSAKLSLAKVEARAGNYDLAKEYFLSLKNTKLERISYYLLIILCIKNNKYEEAFKYIKEAKDNNTWINSNVVIDTCKKLNVFFDMDYSFSSINYTINQLLDYDNYVAIEHITQRHINYHNSDFNKDIDVYKLFNTIQEKLTKENLLDRLDFNDVYIIPFDNIGKNHENYLKVVTLPNTKNIITMYPTFKNFDYSFEELNSDEDLERELTK